MNLSQSAKYLVILSFFVFVVLANWLFTNSHINTERYQTRIAELTDLEHSLTELIQQVLLVENTAFQHFDRVAKLEVKLELAINHLKQDPVSNHHLVSEIRAQLNTVAQAKATYAVFRNSLLYFPKGNQLLINKLIEKDYVDFVSAFESLERSVILFIANRGNQRDSGELQRKIEQLENKLKLLPEPERQEAEQLLKHGVVLIANIKKLHQLNKSLLESQLTALVAQNIATSDKMLQEEIDRSGLVKIWFYIIILILTFSILLIWRKQQLSLGVLRKNTKELSLAASVFKETHDGIVITDADQNIIDVNPAFTDITGYQKQDVIGKNPKMLSSGRQGTEFYDEMWQSLDNKDFWKGEVWNRDKNGELYAELLTISVVKNRHGDVVNYVGIFSDISDIKKQHEKLNLMAHYDVLTKLPNRTLFADRFHQAIAHSKRSKTLLALCFLDLDDFKPVNDNYGHEMGDSLLVEVAQRIQSCIREEDTVSRQGGDEFALLLSDLNTIDECYQTLERIHDALSHPFKIDGYILNISVSTGVTLFPNDDGDVDTLLRHADHAMYLAKQAGRNRFHIFNPEQDQEQVYKYARINLVEQALLDGQFELYYQPKVNMVTGKVMGAEALLRWNHPEKGVLPPASFLPSIIGTDVEIAIGEWVVDQALQQIERWSRDGLSLEVSVNIASKHLLSKNFTKRLKAKLAQYPSVSPDLLQLEILESSALGDLDEVRAILTTCMDELGVQIALDDFGTGYSSLTHLRNLPVNTIKIDRSFTQKMLDDINDYIIIESVITLASSFGRSVIAEGVETTDQGMMLILMGCYQAQGYAISKPLPVDKFVQWLEHFTLAAEWETLGQKQLTSREKKAMLFELVSENWQKIYLNKYFNRAISDGAGKYIS